MASFEECSGCRNRSLAQIVAASVCLFVCFSRKRSEGFPFIVGGLGVGPVFASCLSCRRGLVVGSSSCRRGVVVGSSWARRRVVVVSSLIPCQAGKLSETFSVFFCFCALRR